MATTKEKLETINSDFNSQYFDTALKKYGRSVSLVLPQSYDDSLTFYEAINKLMYTLNGEILRAQSAENTIATDQDSLQATVDAIAHAEIATDLITTITVTEDNGSYTVTYTTVDGETHEAGTIMVPTNAITNVSMTSENGIYNLNYTTADNAQHDIGIIDTSNTVNAVSMTNENGVYTFTQTKTNGTQSAIGTVEVPQNNPVVEIKDPVVENTTNGYDYHSFTETAADGTENAIGDFYLARNQITSIAKNNNEIDIATVDQSGTRSTQQLELNYEEPLEDITSQVTLLTGWGRNILKVLANSKIIIIKASLQYSSTIAVGTEILTLPFDVQTSYAIGSTSGPGVGFVMAVRASGTSVVAFNLLSENYGTSNIDFCIIATRS